MRLGTLVAAALVLGGCAGSGEQGEPGGGMEGTDELVSSMEVKVSESAVRFILHVTNTGEEPMELMFRTSQRYDFIVETPSGEAVWRWSDDMAFLQALSQDTLEPGESWDMDATWDPGDRTGDYVATGVLTAGERELRQSTAFRLP